MVNNINKERTTRHDQSDLMGMKPHGSIGVGRTPQEAKIVGKLKTKKASALRTKGSTSASGEKANVGNVTNAIGHFVNK